MSKFYITTPIYYANDKPHIGHAYTTIAADVVARYHRMIGDEVFFLTGTDEHGSKINQAAEIAGKKTKEFCDEISAYYKNLWDALSISHDDFIRTTEQRHVDGVLKFLKKLKKANAVYLGKYEGYYCEGCERFLTTKELVDGMCPLHQRKALAISEKNYFFKLCDYLEKIKKLIEKDEIKIMPDGAKREALGYFKQWLLDFSISREKVKWGIPFPYEKGQVIYVWVDALSNYVTALGYGKEKFKKFWPADCHFIGRDILKFHAVYWPAMLLAAKEDLPKAIFAHGFFKVSGQKMSKSLGNVIDPNTMIKEYGSDGTRYLLISQFPFGEDGDVKAEKFDEKYNTDLANNLGNLVSRVTRLKVKSPSRAKSRDEKSKVKVKILKLEKLINDAWRNYKRSLNNFQIDGGMSVIFKIADDVNRYIDKAKPWALLKEDEKKFKEMMAELIETLRHIGWMLQPYLPESSKKILKQLCVFEKEKEEKFEKIIKWKKELGVGKLKRGEILFPRVK